MVKIENENVALTAEENGRGLRLIDRKRNTVWELDEQTLLWGGCLTKQESPVPDWKKRLLPLRPAGAGVGEHNTLVVEYSAKDCPVVYTYKLLEDGVEIRLAPPPSQEIEAVSLPGAFLPQNQAMKLLLPIMQGMLWDGRGRHFSHICRSGNQVGFAMQMYGIMAERGGLVAACDTAVDSLWLYEKDERGFRVQNLAESSLGSIRYERVIHFYLTDAGITPIAKRYRRHVKDRGRFVSWEEKLEQRPELKRIFGAVMCYVGYCHDGELCYAKEFAKLKAYGFDQALVYPVAFNCYDRGFRMAGHQPIQMSGEEVEGIKALGYDVCAWTWINEAMDKGDGKRDGMYKVSRDKERIFGWQIDDAKFYKVCSPEMYHFEKESVKVSFKEMTWDHFDVLTCATVGECYAADHQDHLGRPLSRGEDVQWLRKTLLAGYGNNERIAVSSESFNDLFSMEYDMGSYKAWPQYGPWIFWPVPLTSLVYHDGMIHTWYEQHSYNIPYWNRALGPDLFMYGGGRPDLQSVADALMGTPPDIFPCGTQYAFTGRGWKTFSYRYRFEAPITQYALQKAKPVAQLHKKVGMLEMVDFEILSEDGWVQRSAFSDGTEIIANFDIRQKNDMEGVPPIKGMDWIIR